MSIKLNRRLRAINSMVSQGNSHIWDCCCDHGLLGASLLNAHSKTKVHFVDVVAPIMSQLENKLERFYPKPRYSWETHCFDLSQLNLESYTGSHVLIIAGVGGQLCAQLLTQITANNPNAQLSFILCPVGHQFELRAKLINLDFNLLDEVLVKDNKRYYEILSVSPNSAEPRDTTRVHPVGQQIWRAHNDISLQDCLIYQQRTIAHYQRKQLADNQFHHVIQAYQNISIS